MGLMEISHSCSRSPVPAMSTTASENHERMVRERRKENRAMGSVEISCSQSPIPAASTRASGDGERLVRERREENGRRWGAREWVPSRSRRRRREVKMVEGWCRRGGASRRKENNRRWGAQEWVPSRFGRLRQRGRDGERLVQERRENDRRWGPENGFCPDLEGDDGKWRWWKAGAGEMVWERMEENNRRWGARE